MLKKIKDAAISAAKKFYATPTGYRVVWTGIQLGAGAAVVAFGADPVYGALVTLLTTVLTSVARENLAK